MQSHLKMFVAEVVVEKKRSRQNVVPQYIMYITQPVFPQHLILKVRTFSHRTGNKDGNQGGIITKPQRRMSVRKLVVARMETDSLTTGNLITIILQRITFYVMERKL